MYVHFEESLLYEGVFQKNKINECQRVIYDQHWGQNLKYMYAQMRKHVLK